MGIFTEYLKTLRLQNESYHNLILFEVLSPDRMKRPFDIANVNKVLISPTFDTVTFKNTYEENLKILAQLQKVAEVATDEEGKTFPRFKLPISNEKILEVIEIYRQVSSPIIDDIAYGMITELMQNLEQHPELAMSMQEEIEKRAIEFARSYIFNLLSRARLFSPTEANQPTVMALNDLVIVCNAHNPVEEFYMLYENKLLKSMAYEPEKPLVTAASDTKLGRFLLVMGIDRFTHAAEEVFPALAIAANVKPETLILNKIKVTSSKDKSAALAVKILQDTYKCYMKSAQQSAKEIARMEKLMGKSTNIPNYLKSLWASAKSRKQVVDEDMMGEDKEEKKEKEEEYTFKQ